MSFSMPSVWRPEISRRPAMSAAFTMPTATIATRTQASTSLPLRSSMLSIATPTRMTIAIAAAWDSTARIVETMSEALYGSRNRRSRMKVLR